MDPSTFLHFKLPRELVEAFDERRKKRFRKLPRLTLVKAALSLAIESDDETLSKHVGRY